MNISNVTVCVLLPSLGPGYDVLLRLTAVVIVGIVATVDETAALAIVTLSLALALMRLLQSSSHSLHTQLTLNDHSKRKQRFYGSSRKRKKNSLKKKHYSRP